MSQCSCAENRLFPLQINSPGFFTLIAAQEADLWVQNQWPSCFLLLLGAGQLGGPAGDGRGKGEWIWAIYPHPQPLQ